MDNRISNRTAARLLGIAPATLRKWRHERRGPSGYVAYSRSYGTYPESAVIEWLDKKTNPLRTPLADVAAPASGVPDV